MKQDRLRQHIISVHVSSGGNSGGGGAKRPKFPTKLSNFRHTPPFALEKTVLAVF